MMRDFLLSELAVATGGVLHGSDVSISAVSTDSRRIGSGCLFLALRGERFDAHDFLADVQAAGAAAAVVERVNTGLVLPQIEVKDCVKALGDIAAHNRAQFHGNVIALTGSAGKTTTKEMVAAILSVSGTPLVTSGNLNNHIGVPLTLLRIAPGHDNAVVEMGASGPGDICYLTHMARPNIALVTTVAPAHLERFGSVDGVAAGKKEIFESLSANGVAVVNLDNAYTAEWLSDLQQCLRVLTFSVRGSADVFAGDIAETGSGISFTLSAGEQSAAVSMHFLGAHNAANAVAAVACCLAAHVPFEQIVAGLQAARPYKGRLQLREGLRGARVIDDSYNANPASVKMAIDTLCSHQGECVLVLGDMGELGDNAPELHAQIGAYARSVGVKTLLTTGNLSRETVKAFGDGGTHFSDWHMLADHCRAIADKHMTFLIKGSRSAGMERVADALTETETTQC